MKIPLTVIAGTFASGALAQLSPPEQAPSFAEVVMQAQTSSPRLIELEADVRAAQGLARQAAAWPTPQVGMEREDFGGKGVYSGSSSAQTTISIAEPLEFSGQRRARIAAGQAGVVAAEARRALLRADFGYDLAVAYAAAEASQTRSDLLSEDLDRAREDVRSARALVQAGKEGELRAVQAEAAVSAAEADLEAARADAIGALARLASQVGIAEPYQRVQPSLLDSSRGQSTAQAADHPANAPLIATAQAERDSAERRVTVERKRALPTPSFSLGRRRIAGDDANVWVAGISLSLPIFDRNRGAIAAARAELSAADARLAAAHLETNAEWRAATAEAAAANSRLTASDRGETSAREAYRLARIGYDAGRTPLFELQATRRALTEAQLRSLDARLARVGSEASLARLAGRIPFIE